MKDCRYKKRFCKIYNKHCTTEVENGCTEAIIIGERVCPLMAATETPAQNCGCDIAQIRKFWPREKKCFDGNDCLLRKYKPVRDQIFMVTDPSAIKTAFAATATA